MNETITIGFPGLGITGIEVDPIALRIGGLEIRWYGILILTGLLTSVFFGMRKMKKFDHTVDDMLDLLIITVPSAIIGCRLYYCFNKWDLYKNDPLTIITGITEGGLAFFGGLIGAVLSGVIVMKVKKLNIPAILDLYITQFPIAQAIGRWGNFMNGEAFGTHTNLPWGMTILQRPEAIDPVHPTFLYESLWNILVFIILYHHLDRRRFDGQNVLMYLMLYGFGRMFIEGLRTDSLYLGNTGIRISQLLAFIFFVVSLILLIVIPVLMKRRTAAAAGPDYEPIIGDTHTPETFAEVEPESVDTPKQDPENPPTSE